MRGRVTWAQGMLLILPLAILALAAWVNRWVYEDGFIYLHVVQNVLAGNGPVYNVGERVEAYTGPLWVGVLSVAGVVSPSQLPWIAVIVGIVMTLAGVALAILGSARIARRAEPTAFLLPIGALVFVCVAPAWSYASSGLETGLTFLWLGACAWILAKWADEWRGRLPGWALVALGLGPLIRPELAVSSGIFVLTVLLVDRQRQGWLGRLRAAGLALALPAAYELFRMAYFGLLVPTTAIAKEGLLLRPDAGLAYAANFMGPYVLWLPLVLLIAGAYVPLLVRLTGEDRLAQRAAVVAVGISGLLNGLVVVLVGGDYLHARLLLPSLFAICAPVAVVPLRKAYVASLGVIPWAVASAAFLRLPPTVFHPITPGAVTPAQLGFPMGLDHTPWYSGPGLYQRLGLGVPTTRLDPPAIPSSSERLPTLIVGGIGLPVFAAGPELRVYDRFGLANPLAAHMQLTRRSVAGHEKPLPIPWIIAATTRPDSPTSAFDGVVESSFFARGLPLIPLTYGAERARQVDWARRALTCPVIADLVEAPSQQLTLERIWSNVTGAWARTRLRIPPDPQTAAETLCPGSLPTG